MRDNHYRHLLLTLTSMVAQTITQPFTPEQYVNEVLVEEGGNGKQRDVFWRGMTRFGLVTNAAVGTLAVARGVNTDHASRDFNLHELRGLQSDADLESVANSVPSFDWADIHGWLDLRRCALEFDLPPMGIAFRSITCSGPMNT